MWFVQISLILHKSTNFEKTMVWLKFVFLKNLVFISKLTIFLLSRKIMITFSQFTRIYVPKHLENVQLTALARHYFFRENMKHRCCFLLNTWLTFEVQKLPIFIKIFKRTLLKSHVTNKTLFNAHLKGMS